MTDGREHERQFVLSFIIRERQNRYLELLEKPNRRTDITDSLAHFKHLDMRYVVRIAPNQQHPPDILKILKEKAAPDRCWAISESDNLDGKEVDLSEALEMIVGYDMGTILSCVPGQLAYFEDEDERWILERRMKR
jgi:hypothetical protein